jgi:Flp pilus assembly protein TadG
MKCFGLPRCFSRLRNNLARLGKDEDGHVLLYFTIMLPVMIGMTGLVLDGGALFHLNSDLQELADASALAGAAELDGKNDAITRATDRAQHLLSNDPHWSNSTLNATGIQISTPTFYSALNPDVVTTDPTQAGFIKVTTVTREVKPTFLHAVHASSNRQTSASAVAGTTSVACNVQPLMLCNPYEGTSDFNATAGQLFVLKQKGSTGGFSPGDFGLVDPPGVNSSGSKTIRNLLAATTPNFCYVNNISPRPGQATGDVSDAINVRFDLAPNGNTTGLDQTPAPNVTKGIMPDTPQHACNLNKYQADGASSVRNYMLPGATAASTTTVGSLTIGSTMDSTAANAYWNYHHGANWPAGITTRFQAYCQELGLGSDCLGSNSPPTWVANTEPRAPQCAPAGVRNSGDYKRRLIAVAIVNCLAQNVQGNSATNLKSNEYGVFFVTNPSPTSQPNPLNNYLGSSSNGEIVAEFVKTINQGDCAVNPAQPYCNGLHQIVQLYR